MELLSPLLEVAYGEIARSDEKATIAYLPSWGVPPMEEQTAQEFTSALLTALEGARRADYERRLTSVGPHRDEPVFRIDRSDARSHGSQGEQRTLALALKLAAHRAVADMMGESPVLLLDDVFSELDPDRALALAKALPPGTQTLITSARPEDVPVEGSVWRVGEGVHR